MLQFPPMPKDHKQAMQDAASHLGLQDDPQAQRLLVEYEAEAQKQRQSSQESQPLPSDPTSKPSQGGS